tara:strand:+ start:708 stop:1847 length:1140 start_codon:yes stop_codon:yes gene_type:complete
MVFTQDDNLFIRRFIPFFIICCANIVSIYYQNLKALLLMLGLFISLGLYLVATNIISTRKMNEPYYQEKCTIFNSSYEIPELSTIILTFIATSLIAPMFFNKSYNVYLIIFFLVIILSDGYFKWISKCMNEETTRKKLITLITGTAWGGVSAYYWFKILNDHYKKNHEKDKYLYYNKPLHGFALCSYQPDTACRTMFLKSLNYTFDLTTYTFYVTNDSSLNKISLDDFLDRELEIGDQELEFLKNIEDFYIGVNKFNIDAKNYGAIKSELIKLSNNEDIGSNDIVDISDNGVVNLDIYESISADINGVVAAVNTLNNSDPLDTVFDNMIQYHEKTFTLYYKKAGKSEQTLVKFPVDLSYNQNSDSYEDVSGALATIRDV